MEHPQYDSFIELARHRRSIRAFTTQKIPQDVVVELMKAPLLSPSSKSRRPWDFVLVDAPFLLHQLSECKASGAQFIEHAALAVVVVVNKDLSDVWIEDGAVASTMLLLQAESLGLGGCWVQIRQRGQEDGTPAGNIVREILNIPNSLDVLSIIALGYKAQERKPIADDKLLWEKIHINSF